ncbi:hypothetical protein CP532_6247 [Ophiocordyceps camponoti-leonardi (nom. inval.)]|nr:hypothetical protein CP532_6247 [Ophiocordyceps camponoti-leonardi (nom. inval.)]
MFSFNKAALPRLNTRKALIAVDLQNDFVVGDDGDDNDDSALPVSEPDGFVTRTIALAEAFRAVGDVVWVQSRFEEPRPVDAEHIIVSDEPPKPPSPPPVSRRGGRRPRPKPTEEDPEPDRDRDLSGPSDPEAFLSGDVPACVRPESPGAELAPVVKDAVRRGDPILIKTHYSAFQGTALLRRLQSHMVTEVFICGSLINVGVYATTLDAAGHGMTITLVEDCCGYRSDVRQVTAVKNLVHLTGCNVATSEGLLRDIIRPQEEKTGEKSPTEGTTEDDLQVEGAGKEKEKPDEAEDKPSDLLKSMAELRLVSSSPEDETPAIHEAIVTTSPDDQAPLPESSSSEEDEENEDDDEDEEEEEEDDDDDHQAFCEGDTHVITNVLPPSLEHDIFDRLRCQLQWQPMSHQGSPVPRLVAVQGTVSADGSAVPIYRHPADESPPLLPFSEPVLAIKAEVERHLGHPVNHALIQLYRDGSDHISEHSDKTLDIVPGSFIANLSLGAQRTMVFRTKRAAGNASRLIQRAVLPHNSLCRMGLRTNMKWLHAIRQDRRADRDKIPPELAFDGARISLTFRRIGTFLDPHQALIWGQGAKAKTRAEARPVIDGQGSEAIEMLRAFGTENHASAIDWEDLYGGGFDVLHIRSAPRFFASDDAVVNMRISLMLAELGVSHAKGRLTAGDDDLDDDDGYDKDVAVRFVDNDAPRTTVCGEMAIMLYLDSCYGGGQTASREELGRRFTHFQRALRLLDVFRSASLIEEAQDKSIPSSSSQKDALPKLLRRHLQAWNAITDSSFSSPSVSDNSSYLFLAGTTSPSLPDFALWPVLHVVVERYGLDVVLGHLDGLRRYYDAFSSRDSISTLVAKKDAGS